LTARTLSIHVEANNPARRLYERLGFRSVADHGVYLLLERAPVESLCQVSGDA
jgi:ribosomal protein S18 acetylase RimI-like enzyme